MDNVNPYTIPLLSALNIPQTQYYHHNHNHNQYPPPLHSSNTNNHCTPQTPQNIQQFQDNDKVTRTIIFNRKKVIKKKYKSLLQAVKDLGGMEGYETITINITKTGDVDSDSETESDDNYNDNIDTKQQQKATKRKTTQSAATESDHEFVETDLRTTLEYTLLHSIDRRVNKTLLRINTGVSDKKSILIFKLLKKLNIMEQPGSCHFFFAEEIFIGPQVEYNHKLHCSKVKIDIDIKDDKIKNIYSEIANKVNRERGDLLKKLEKQRLESLEASKSKKKTNKKRTKKDAETNGQPPAKKRKVDNDRYQHGTNDNAQSNIDKQSRKQSFCKMVLKQKDMIKLILSFLATDRLDSEMSIFQKLVLAASYYIEQEMIIKPKYMFDETTHPHSFTVLPVTYKYLSKQFNQCVNEMSHLMVSIQHCIQFTKISQFPSRKHLIQLYLIQDLSQYNYETNEQIYEMIETLQNCNFPKLKILQIHFFRQRKPIDIKMNAVNFPELSVLILGTIHNDDFRSDHSMRINKMNLDLDIYELRIQHCSINDIDSLRFSLAKCSLIDTLYLMLKPDVFNKKQRKVFLLHSLYLPSVNILFVQSDILSEITIIAPKLIIIQFYFCDKLDRLILSDRIPGTLRSHVGGKPDETPIGGEIIVIFDNCYEDLMQRHIPNFTVLKNGKKYNEHCQIRFTCATRNMLVWPYASYD